MSTYKRWFAPLLVVEGVAIAPGVLRATNYMKRAEKRQQQLELRAWEGEGGNPAPPGAAVRSSLLAETPEVDMGNPSSKKTTER